ncbi:MAG: TetR/AcrR family transcriptional regulator [Desulfobacteraceae bacterium]|jgi:AcrR family transcriptional regulator|nr:MAG: TetR/AcrR family transcriptional regulator [Desulfobacteraceae bacterium]
MALEKLDTQVRREQIVEAALSLVRTHGMKNLSIAGVARRVGLVPSGIYRHFKSKDEILEAALDLIGRRLLGNVEAACNSTSDTLECLKLLLMGHVRLIRENEAIPRLIFSDEVYGGNPSRKAKMHGIITEYLGEVAKIIREGQQKGHVRRDVDPGTISMMFLGIIQPGAILWHLSGGKFDVTKYVESGWRVLKEALKVQ